MRARSHLFVCATPFFAMPWCIVGVVRRMRGYDNLLYDFIQRHRDDNVLRYCVFFLFEATALKLHNLSRRLVESGIRQLLHYIPFLLNRLIRYVSHVQCNVHAAYMFHSVPAPAYMFSKPCVVSFVPLILCRHPPCSLYILQILHSRSLFPRP